MRDLAVLFIHLITTVARLAGPGGARSVVAESILVKQQLLIVPTKNVVGRDIANEISSTGARTDCEEPFSSAILPELLE